MLRYKHIYLIAFLLLTMLIPMPDNSAGTCHGRNRMPSAFPKQYIFGIKELPNQRLLPVANIHRILQDSEGYMWYATEGGGLCRDDGYRIEVFRSDRHTPSLLANNDITCMTEDKYGRIWFGTKEGTYILDKKDYTINRIEGNELHDAWTGCMFTSSDSAIWIGSGTNIYRYTPDGNTFEVFRSEWNGKAVNVTNFTETSATGVIAVQSTGGIVRFDTTRRKFVTMEWDSKLRPNFIVPDTRHGGMWIATWGQGIVKYKLTPKGHGVIIRQPCTVGSEGEGNFRSQVLNILYDKPRNILWAAAMDNLYAYEVKGDSLAAIDTRMFLPERKKILDNIVSDRFGNIWVPGFSPHTFIVYQENNRMRRDEVRTMPDSIGYRVMVDRIVRENLRYYWIWQGRTQLSLYDSYTGKVFFTRTSASPAPLAFGKCMEKKSADKGIWTCNGTQIFHVWNEGESIVWEEEQNANTGQRVNTLYDKGGQTLYIGTVNAVFRYDYANMKLAKIADNVGCVNEISCDGNGSVYFIADNAGLCRFDQKQHTLQRIDTPRNHNVATFTSLTIAPDGNVWTATSEGNVFFLPKGKLQLIEDEWAGNSNGDGIKNIVSDKYGNIWILSDKYLREYSPKTGGIQTINSSDAHIDMDYFHTIRLENDSICLGGIGAFCMIATVGQDCQLPHIPQIKVAGIKSNGTMRMVGLHTQQIEVPHNYNEVELYISTFDFLHADSIQFAYRTGAEKVWTSLPSGSNRIVLHNLPYGKCKIEINATDRNRNKTGKTEFIIIYRLKPWYATWQAYTIYIFLLAAVASLCLYKRNKRRKKQEESSPDAASEEKKTQEYDKTQKDDDRKEVPHISKQDEEFILRATAIVEQNIDNTEYSVEQFSSDLCMSRMNLYRKLQNLTGQKPSEFIRKIRLEKAAYILLSEECSVAELVDRIGFGTPRYFSKCFKETYGMSPSQYRQQQTSKEDNYTN
ncbi:MAG: AraC family transcriptional regulator [Bacteroides sp.]|nr:AraC family transcriptional regulator [Roseburia sp.]MCM1347375.1 AraC family transcriptional regulator [Bacteroides sp.]MCM1421862.1 AraC family transcriptional regulator [Bacteroides sp.]